MAHRWDLQGDLDVAHPFKSSPPEIVFDANFSDVALLIKGDSTPNDQSSNTRALTLSGGVDTSLVQTYWGGGAIYHDGVDDMIQIPNAPVEFREWWTGGFTVEAWIYPTNLTTWDGSDNSRPIFCGHQTEVSSANYWSFGPIGDGKLDRENL